MRHEALEDIILGQSPLIFYYIHVHKYPILLLFALSFRKFFYPEHIIFNGSWSNLLPLWIQKWICLIYYEWAIVNKILHYGRIGIKIK